MTYEESGIVTSSRVWSITTTDGQTTSAYLPAWAQGDPSKSGVTPERLAIELADVTHETCFGGECMPVSEGARESAELKPMLIAHMQCSPFAGGDDLDGLIPRLAIQLLEDIWIKGLDPAGAVEMAEKFRRFGDLLVMTVTPALYAARADWAAHVTARQAPSQL